MRNPQYPETLTHGLEIGSIGSHLSSSSSCLHLLPSAPSPGVKASNFFLNPWCFSSGRLPFALFQSSLDPCFSAHWPPLWLPQLLSHWSGSRTIPLTLVTDSWPLLRYSSTGPAYPAWSSREPSDLSGWDQDIPPLACCRMSLERIVGTCNILGILVSL